MENRSFAIFLLYALVSLAAFNLVVFPLLREMRVVPPPPVRTPEVLPASTQAVSSCPKEVYIPLGSGSVSSSDWTEMGGVEAVIDLSRYPDIETVVFEASLRVPTANGRVYAKLYNVSDGHDAWYSEVWSEGSAGFRAEAKGVILSSGRKVYRVKMKSTMGYEAVLDLARLKILLK